MLYTRDEDVNYQILPRENYKIKNVFIHDLSIVYKKWMDNIKISEYDKKNG